MFDHRPTSTARPAPRHSSASVTDECPEPSARCGVCEQRLHRCSTIGRDGDPRRPDPALRRSSRGQPAQFVDRRGSPAGSASGGRLLRPLRGLPGGPLARPRRLTGHRRSTGRSRRTRATRPRNPGHEPRRPSRGGRGGPYRIVGRGSAPGEPAEQPGTLDRALGGRVLLRGVLRTRTLLRRARGRRVLRRAGSRSRGGRRRGRVRTQHPGYQPLLRCRLRGCLLRCVRRRTGGGLRTGRLSRRGLGVRRLGVRRLAVHRLGGWRGSSRHSGSRLGRGGLGSGGLGSGRLSSG